MTLGTVFNHRLDVFSRIIQGLRDEPLNVVVTLGHGNDPASLGPQPANVRVERYVDQSLLLPHVDAVVTHGGSGSVLGALGHGVPLLVVPQGADQFRNAERCHSTGVGRRLLPAELEAPAVRRHVLQLLEAPAFRQRARAVQEEIADMPAASEVVARLESVFVPSS